MPELGTLTRSGLPQIVYDPRVPTFGPAPAPLPPNLVEANKIAAHAQVLGQTAKIIADMPGQIQDAYQKGTKISLTNQEDASKRLGLGVKNQVLSGTALTPGQSAAFRGMTFGADGSSTLKIEDPDDEALKTAERKARIAQIKASAAHLANGGSGSVVNPIAETYGTDGLSTPPAVTFTDPFGETSTISPDGTTVPPGTTASPIRISPKVKPGPILPPSEPALPENPQATDGSFSELWRESADPASRPIASLPIGPTQFSPISELPVGSASRVTPPTTGRPALPGELPMAGVDAKIEDIKKLREMYLADPPSPERERMLSQLDTDEAAIKPKTAAPSGDSTSGSIPPSADAHTPITAESALAARGGKKLTDQGPSGGAYTRFPGFDREDFPDGSYKVYKHVLKPGEKYEQTFAAPVKPVKYSAGTLKLASEAGYHPKANESEADVAEGARKLMAEKEKVPPEVRAPYFKWATSLQANPVVKEFYTARHQNGVVEAALSRGLTPAAALGTIDAYVKAMRGGAATQGMTKILEEAQPAISRLQLLWQRMVGDPTTSNAVLTPAMAGDVKHILGQIESNARKEVEGMMEGDKDHWSTFDVPPAAVEKTYQRIFGGKKSSLDYDPAPATAPAATTTAPSAAVHETHAGTHSDPHKPNTDAEYDAIPAGQFYEAIDPRDGKLKIHVKRAKVGSVIPGLPPTV